MIVSIKDKILKTYVDDSNVQHITNIDMENASINYANNLTFASLHNTALTITDFKVEVSGTHFKIAYKDGTTSNFKEVTTASDTELKIADSGGKQIRKWNLYLLHTDEGTFTTTMTISYKIGGTPFTHKINATCTVIGIAEKFILLSQNFKFAITDDYYKAFKDSDYKASETDQRLLNEKRKEFLLNYFDLSAQVGSYHTLLAALHYFGYGDLLSIRELWKNGDKRMSTKITSQVQDFIDNRLSGFRKTNQLQLIYQINKEDGTTDSDGFDNYVSVLFDTEEMLIKMHALKRVLEKDFLPLNTKIVDIIGEHTSTLGVDAKLWLNDQRIDEVALNNQNDNGFTFEYDQRNIEINEHEVLLKNKHFIATASGTHTGTYPSGVTDSNLLSNIYFEINKELTYDITTTTDYTSLLNDNDYVERYDRSDFGLVRLIIGDIDTTQYNRWKYEVYEPSVSETTPQFTTPLYNISDLPSDKKLIFGVRKIGTFKVVVYMFDNYGGVTIMNNDNQTFTVSRGNVDFKLARIDRATTANAFDRSLDFWSTHPTDTTTVADRVVEIDAYDSTLNVNTFNESTHTNKILRYQAKKYDLRTLQMNTFQFNNVALTELENTRLYDYGYEYARYVVDLIGNGNTGVRELKIRLFEHEAWDTISLTYNSATYPTKEEFNNAIVTLINNKPSTSVWSRFTAVVQEFSTDGTIANKTSVIRIVAKNAGESIKNVYTDFTSVGTYSPVVNFSENYYTIMPLSGYIDIHPKLSTSNGDLKVNGTLVSNIAINTVAALKTALQAHFTANNIKATIFEYTNNIVISTRVDLKIEHPTFGTAYDVARGSESMRLKMVKSGDSFYMGEPFYAYIDLNTRIDGMDFEWTLTNALTGEVIDTQKSYVYRNMLVKKGSYNLQLKSTDGFGSNTKIKNGFIVVA